MNFNIELGLSRHRTVSIAALVLLVLLAWAWLLVGAGMETKPLVSLAPVSGGPAHESGMAMAKPMATPWSTAHIVLIFSMWWVMMVATMLPSAAPTILLYARAAMRAQDTIQPATGSFLVGYLVVWGAYSLAATLLQILFEQIGLLIPMSMASQSRWLSAVLLISAGIYQLSPLKNVCLRHCQNPAQFLSRNFRSGPKGALRMGALHGSYCVGCCWLLMALLFVGGVMNLAWIALLTLMVAAEKLLPFGRYVSIGTGLACILWGTVMVFG